MVSSVLKTREKSSCCMELDLLDASPQVTPRHTKDSVSLPWKLMAKQSSQETLTHSFTQLDSFPRPRAEENRISKSHQDHARSCPEPGSDSDAHSRSRSRREKNIHQIHLDPPPSTSSICRHRPASNKRHAQSMTGVAAPAL